jgi:hypothetical protein
MKKQPKDVQKTTVDNLIIDEFLNPMLCDMKNMFNEHIEFFEDVPMDMVSNEEMEEEHGLRKGLLMKTRKKFFKNLAKKLNDKEFLKELLA